MGWSSSHYWQSREDVVEVLREFSGGFVLLDESSHGSEYYQLVKRPDGVCFISVNLIQKLDGDYGYKTMDESMIPLYFNCPERILKKSTAMDENAVEWRNLCRKERSRKKAWSNVFKSLSVNDVVTFSNDNNSNTRSFRFSSHWNKSKTQPIGFDIDTQNRYRYPLSMMLKSWDNIKVSK